MPVTNSSETRTIAILTSYPESLYNFRGNLIEKFVAEGFNVYAISPDLDANIIVKIEKTGATAVPIIMQRNGLNAFQDIRSTYEIYKILKKIKATIFFGYFIKPVIFGSLAAWMAGVPRRVVMVAGLGFVFINGQSRALSRAGILKTLVSKMYNFAFKVSDLVIFQNSDDMALMTAKSPALREKSLLVNGSGVDLERFCPDPSPATVQTQTLTFIWTGRLLREKGVFELVEAARLLRAQGFSFKVLLVGGVDSNPGSLARETVQAWHDSGSIIWTGKVDDVRPFLRRSHVFVLPSYREGLPRSTQEAMATGLAVITTDAPGCRETVVDGVNGILVPVRSAHAIADAMRRYINDPLLAEQHGQASLELVKKRFDVEIINQQMRDAIVGSPDC